MTIPKIIHQTWKTENIPTEFRSFVNSWKTKNADWHYVLWTDRDCKRFIKANYPDFLKLYNAYDEQIKRIDAFRYFLLHHCGGLYVDIDFECLKPFDVLTNSENKCLLGLEPELHAKRLYNKNRLICNAIMASPPKHKFWEHVFTTLIKCRNEKNVLEATGPGMLGKAFDSYHDEDVVLFPDNMFCPLVDMSNKELALTEAEQQYYTDMLKNHSFPDVSHAVHHWAGTWYSKGVRVRLGRIFTRLSAHFKGRLSKESLSETYFLAINEVKRIRENGTEAMEHEKEA